MTRGWSAVVVAACLAAGPSAKATEEGGPPARRFALIVGNNASPRPDLPRLRYADDDAVRWAVLLSTMGATVEVLTELDDQSRRLYGQAAPQTQPPSRAALTAAVARLARQIREEHARGGRAVAYFVYAGHGDVEDGKGSISLVDGWLARDELGTAILAPLGADTNHVIVDACRASYLLGNRGPGGERRQWQDAYFRPGEARFAHTGFLLASSSSGLSHEWEEFQAGIFSHEVRSGLLGPADANGDGRITYRELIGFVRLANRPIRNDKYRPEIVSRPPSDGPDVLLDLRDVGPGSVSIGRYPATHQYLEDRAGVRWADLHPSGVGTVRIALPRAGWEEGGFYLRAIEDDVEYAIPAGRDVAIADLTPGHQRVLPRGAIHDAFSHLFELPFDAVALERLAFDPDLPELRVEGGPALRPSPSPVVRPVAIGALAVGAASVLLAVGLEISALRLQDDVSAASSGTQRIAINEDIGDRNQAALIAAVGGAVLVGLGGVLLHWSKR